MEIITGKGRRIWIRTVGNPVFDKDGESGTGPGLLLCREFVEKHGGTIQAEGQEGVGYIFTFTLPAKRH